MLLGIYIVSCIVVVLQVDENYEIRIEFIYIAHKVFNKYPVLVLFYFFFLAKLSFILDSKVTILILQEFFIWKIIAIL